MQAASDATLMIGRARARASPVRRRRRGSAPPGTSRRGRARCSLVSGSSSFTCNPKPALFTSTSIGRSASASRAATRATSARTRQVGGQGFDVHAVALGQFGRALGEPLGVPGHQHEIVTAVGQGTGERGADSGARAGDECGGHAGTLPPVPRPSSGGGRRARRARAGRAGRAGGAPRRRGIRQSTALPGPRADASPASIASEPARAWCPASAAAWALVRPAT